MNELIEKVKEWNSASGVPQLEAPGVPTMPIINLRLDLLEEEIRELEAAAHKKDMVEILDALCDIQYILLGAVTDYGMQEVFAEAFNEVHESNMSKFLTKTQDARESVLRYMDKGVESHYRLVGKRFVIRRNSDDKILKGLKFFNPRLRAILKENQIRKNSNEKD